MEKFIIGEKNIVLNFSKNYCKTEGELLSSDAFKKVWESYLKRLAKSGKTNLIKLTKIAKNSTEDFIALFKVIASFKIEEAKNISPLFNHILSFQEDVYEMVEDFYEYWRKMQRYSILTTNASQKSMVNLNFIDSTQDFTELVLRTYRNISQKLYGHTFHVYRQLPSGINASMLVTKNDWQASKEYDKLKNLMFIDAIVIRPPFIVYSDKNTRKGTYQEVYENPIKDLKLDSDEWYCYPAYVGESLAYVYFHQDYISHGITLCNLFEFVHLSQCKGKKPDLVYVFGAKVPGESVFYHDKANDIYVGLAPHGKEIDYFGYMKKMLLTLHNTRMINQGYLPIHGACVNITFKNGLNKTLVVIGDSGAGKSESLEALRAHAGDNITSMQTIFDDMGSFRIENGKVVAYGTEIGAFVRLDDLENGYAYKEMDRAIFMNPDKINSRVVIPVATYSTIMKGFNVDMVFYANNYEDKPQMEFFTDMKEALDMFRSGARVAKGTTSEKGLVTSYFANPFGPVQRQEQCEILLKQYFNKLYETKVGVGSIYTKLAISGMEHSGPKAVAEKLFEVLGK